MYDYALTGFVVGLWWYDNLLLLKIQRMLARRGKEMGWQAMKMYTLLVQKNEMKKDGYHVDSVYVYTHDNPEETKQYDMLRIFRDCIREEKLSLNKSMHIYDFIEMCCDPNSNFTGVDRNKNYELEVNYTFDYSQYKIVFDTRKNTTVRFPVYSEKDIHNRDIMSGGITYAFIAKNQDDEDGIEITDQIKKLSGPMENFYDDKEYVVEKQWLFRHSTIPETGFIKVVDFKGEEHTFKPEDEFFTFKRANDVDDIMEP